MTSPRSRISLWRLALDVRRSGWRSLAGLLLVAIGTLLFVDRVDRIGGHGAAPELLWQWWPLLIVAAGCVNLLRLVPRPWLLLGPLLTVVVGLVLLSFTAGTAERRLAGAWTRHYPVAWPMGIVVAGFWVGLAGSEWVTRRTLTHDRTKVVALRGDEIDIGGVPFRKGRYVVVLGHLQLDLSQAEFVGISSLDIMIVFGRAQIVVPHGLTTEVRRAFVLTGRRFTHTVTPPGSDANLVVNILGLFGDAEIHGPPALQEHGNVQSQV
jgi:hypothetical protein